MLTLRSAWLAPDPAPGADLTAGQIVNRLTKRAGLPDDAKGLKLPDQKYGYGYIQPLAAPKQNIPAGPQ
ncbi:hypothetical protein [Streptomyces viridochromogenes]|uniref:hypothetical protein n=1 Tax=Streptomyces viridochromogenes TaxID=1938 RepID=UPI00065C9E6A|nr:hypothetical protein [Streptomyces viridochromogenes]